MEGQSLLDVRKYYSSKTYIGAYARWHVPKHRQHINYYLVLLEINRSPPALQNKCCIVHHQSIILFAYIIKQSGFTCMFEYVTVA